MITDELPHWWNEDNDTHHIYVRSKYNISAWHRADIQYVMVAILSDMVPPLEAFKGPQQTFKKHNPLTFKIKPRHLNNLPDLWSKL